MPPGRTVPLTVQARRVTLPEGGSAVLVIGTERVAAARLSAVRRTEPSRDANPTAVAASSTAPVAALARPEESVSPPNDRLLVPAQAALSRDPARAMPISRLAGALFSDDRILDDLGIALAGAGPLLPMIDLDDPVPGPTDPDVDATLVDAGGAALEPVVPQPDPDAAPDAAPEPETVAAVPGALSGIDHVVEARAAPTITAAIPSAEPIRTSPAPLTGRAAALGAAAKRGLRFAWRTDVDGRLSYVSPHFVAGVGPGALPAEGESLEAFAARCGIAGLAEALGTGEGFSDLAALWPIDEQDERAEVTLSGEPGDAGAGWRGAGLVSGIARPVEAPPPDLPAAVAEADMDDEPEALVAAAAGTEAEVTTIAEPKNVPETTTEARPGPRLVTAAPAGRPDAEAQRGASILPFPGADSLPARRLTPTDDQALRTIARVLGGPIAVPSPADGSAPAGNGVAASPPHASHDAELPALDAAIDAVLAAGPTAETGPMPAPFVSQTVVEMPAADAPEANAGANAGALDAISPRGDAPAPFVAQTVVPLAVSSEEAVPSSATRPLAPDLAETTRLAGGTLSEAESRSALEAALREARAREAELTSILDTATDGVVLLSCQGDVLSLNRSAEALFGVEARDVVGEPAARLFAPESQRALSDYLDGLSRNGVASVLNDGREVTGVERNGGRIPLFMTIGRLSVGTADEKFCAVLRDITIWKKAEADLTEAKRAAEAASHQKSDFLAKVSHEIRTPLNAVIGFSEVIMEERFGALGNPRYKDYLSDIQTAGQHLLSLADDLLDLSKIEAGRLEMTFSAVKLGDLIAQTVATMQPQANREGVILRSTAVPRVPPVVADLRSIRQILFNLVSNAIRFTKPGGQVIVSATTTEAGEVALRVRDTGIGMTETEIATAMEPFRQIATASRASAGGTGLGLPLTKALAEANRAAFRIESVPDEGTLVEVTFPAPRVLAE
jgi:PAS domain S-box-containing protein